MYPKNEHPLEHVFLSEHLYYNGEISLQKSGFGHGSATPSGVPVLQQQLCMFSLAYLFYCELFHVISILSVWVAIAEVTAWSYDGGSAADALARSTTDWYLGGGIEADGGGDDWFAE